MAEKPLKQLRLALGISGTELADRLGVSHDAVVAWEQTGALPLEVVALVEEAATRLGALGRGTTELESARALLDGVDVQIRRLSGFTTADVMVAPQRAFHGVPDHNAVSVRDLQVLRRQAWGKVLRLRDVDTGEEREFRIAWGARGWADLNIWSRSAPTISRLMSADRGELVEIPTKGALREFEVVEVTVLQRHTENLLGGNYDNFAALEYDLDDTRQPAERAIDLRRWLTETRQVWLESLRERRILDVQPEEPLGRPALDHASRAALGDRFFMQPLRAQEDVMRWPPSGHVLVEGVAGSGKTSVALGRAAMLCMERPDNGPIPFTPETGVGFVLSDQLVGYLEQVLRGALNLEKMPVKSYFRLRQDLLAQRRLLAAGWKREGADREDAQGAVGMFVWADTVDRCMPPFVADALLGAVPDEPRALVPFFDGSELRDAHWNALAPPWKALRDHFRAALAGPSLSRTLERVDAARGRFAETIEKLNPWDSPKYRASRRKLNQRLRDAVAQAFTFAERYREAVLSPSFGTALLSRVRGGRDVGEFETAFKHAQARLAERRLSNGDVDCLLYLADAAADGYRGRDGAEPIHHLAETPRFSHVFIDEVQDFTEVQTRLMIAQADPAHRAVTAVGDFAQQLTATGMSDANSAGLDLEDERCTFLDVNKRQSAALAQLAHAFRTDIQRDKRRLRHEKPRPSDERAAWLGHEEDAMVEALRRVLRATRRDQPSYSMAVICPSAERARQLEALLHEDMWSEDIPTRVFERADAAKLCDSFHVHFTTPIHTKGLEFDAVFVIDIDAYDLDVEVERAAVYVALSRARRRLGIAGRTRLAGVLAEALGPHVDMSAAAG